MTIEEIIKTILVQSPAIAILLYFINRLYTDWQTDRQKAMEQRERTLVLMERLEPRVESIEHTLDIVCQRLDAQVRPPSPIK